MENKKTLEKVAKNVQKYDSLLNRWNFSSGIVGNKRIGRNFFKELINVWYGIRACWVENFMKINKRTPTLIR